MNSAKRNVSVFLYELGSDQAECCYISMLTLKIGCFGTLNACFWHQKGKKGSLRKEKRRSSLRLTFGPQVTPHYDLADLSRLNPQRI